MPLPQPINISYVNAPDGNTLTYIIKDTDNIINVDTTLGPVNLYLPNIRTSGIIGNSRLITVNDLGGNAALNPITLLSSGEDTIYGETSLELNVNGINVQCSVCDINKWIVNDMGLKLPLYPDLVTDSLELQFQTDTIYGSPSAPLTGDITLSEDALDRAKRGVTNLIIHNDSVEPSFPAQFQFLNGTYEADVINYIYCEFIDENTILATISQVQ